MGLNIKKMPHRPYLRIKIGDVFAVKIDERNQKFFQYGGNDLTQLNSNVIRAFRTIYPVDFNLDLNQIVRDDDVEFFAHVILRLGAKLGYWSKVGNVPEVGRIDVLFRDSNDYGNPDVKISHDWHVWRINEPFVKIGTLSGAAKKAEIGVVIAPDSIVHRMRTGTYDFIYPGY